MLLHGHEVNAQREARGLDPVNSVWLSGCGTTADATRSAPLLDDRLRTPALREDWAAWTDAWHALDAGPIAALLAASGDATLTLAGERRAVPFTRVAASPWHRLRSAWRRPLVHQVLDGL